VGEGGEQGGGIPRDKGVESVREAKKERAASWRVRKLHNIAYRFANEKKGKSSHPTKMRWEPGLKITHLFLKTTAFCSVPAV